MTIESAPGQAVVCLSRGELESYGIDCDIMSLSDGRTRVLLRDVLNMLAHMGVISGTRGRRHIHIDCACGSAGGCTLFFTSRRAGSIRFPNDDAVISAASAGAFTDGMTLLPDGGGYILLLPEDTDWMREGLLREFAEDDPD